MGKTSADIPKGAPGEIMYGIVRYSFTVVASFCVAVLVGERAFAQVPKGEVADVSWHDCSTGLRRLLFDMATERSRPK